MLPRRAFLPLGSLAVLGFVGLVTPALSEGPLPALDDPPVSITFQGGSGIETLNLAISQHLSKRPGLTRYSGFHASLDGVASIRMPEAFTGTIEQLVKSIACVNEIGYRDFGPDGVVFVPTSPEHPMPKCPGAVTTAEVKRKAMTLPGNPAAYHLPGRQGVERLFPGYTKPSPLPAEGGPSEDRHAPSQ